MYEDIRTISVVHSNSLELIVDNPTVYKLINKGAQGAVFRLDETKCVKIYADRIDAELEAKSYHAAQHTRLMPKLFESGENYNIIEYIDGPNLYDYLKDRGQISIEETLKIMQALEVMRAVGFSRLDAALWHFLIDKNDNLRLIDIVHAMVSKDPLPVMMITNLYKLGLLEVFLQQVKIIDEAKYLIWSGLKPNANYL